MPKNLPAIAKIFAVGEAVGIKHKHRPGKIQEPEDTAVQDLPNTLQFATVVDSFLTSGALPTPPTMAAAILEIPEKIRGNTLNCLATMENFPTEPCKCAEEIWQKSGGEFAPPIFVARSFAAGIVAGLVSDEINESSYSAVDELCKVTSVDKRCLSVSRAIFAAAFGITVGIDAGEISEKIRTFFPDDGFFENCSVEEKLLADLEINDDHSCAATLKLLLYMLKAIQSAEAKNMELSIKKTIQMVAALGGYADINCAMTAALICARWPQRPYEEKFQDYVEFD